MHNIFKLGKYWENIEHYEHQALCRQCDNTTETLEHVLTEYTASGQNHIWKLVKDLHMKRGILFEKLSLGDQLGCGLIWRNLPHNKKGVNRFLKMVIAKAARTI